MNLSTEQLYGTNMFIIYNKLPGPVKMIFIKYMQHPVAALLNPKKNKILKSKNFQDSKHTIVKLWNWDHYFEIDIDTNYMIPASWELFRKKSYLYWQHLDCSEEDFSSTEIKKINDVSYRKSLCSKCLNDCCFSIDDIGYVFYKLNGYDSYYIFDIIDEKFDKVIPCSCTFRQVDSLFKKYKYDYPFNLDDVDAYFEKLHLWCKNLGTEQYITYPGSYSNDCFDIYCRYNYNYEEYSYPY